MQIIHLVLCLALATLATPVFILLLQVIASLFFKQASATYHAQYFPQVAVLIPAHNESLVITQTLQALLPQLKSVDQLIVVADNCSDDTALISRSLGATVLERSNETLRGKGYALDYGLQHLKSHSPEVVIIVDADCIISANAIEWLSKACLAEKRPTQALYLMLAQPNPSIKSRVAAFAWLVKNKVRPLGFKAMGLPCQLMGTGMAFLWTDISQINLANGHIVEDMKLGVDFARANKAPIFLPDALVTSTFPPSQAATNTQRTRWEHGHLSVILTELPSLLLEAIKHQNLQMLGLACDLLVPPLAVLALLLMAMLSLSFLATYLLADTLFLNASIALCVFFSAAIILAWFKYGGHIISFKQLCYAPIYALLKLPLYIQFFINRQVEWVRSKRD